MKERDGIGQHIATHHLADSAQHGLRGHVEHFEALARWQHEQSKQPMINKACERCWRIEEVERVARRRGVDHDEIEAMIAVQLVQLFGRHVFLRAR